MRRGAKVDAAPAHATEDDGAADQVRAPEVPLPAMEERRTRGEGRRRRTHRPCGEGGTTALSRRGEEMGRAGKEVDG